MNDTTKVRQRRNVLKLPYLETPKAEAETITSIGREAAERAIRINSYHQFAQAKGHKFSIQSVYNQCQVDKIRNVQIDGFYFVILTAEAFAEYKAQGNT